MTTDWDEQTKRRSRLLFGQAEKVTWAFMHLMLKLFPTMMIKVLLHDLTVLDVDEVLKRMTQDDLILHHTHASNFRDQAEAS